MANTTALSLQQALKLHQAGQFSEAEQIYRSILRVDARHADANHLLGVLAYQQGQHQSAIERINKGLDRAPRNPVFLNNIGAAYRALGNYAEARSAYERALRAKPDYVDAHNNLGTVHFAQGRYAEAEKCYLAALRCNPRFAEAHVNIGNIRQAEDRFADAERCYRHALELNSQDPLALNNLGNSLQRQGRTAEARDAFMEALRLNPKYPDALTNLGLLLQSEGRWRQAAGALELAATIESTGSREIARALVLPTILESADHALTLRRELRQRLDRLETLQTTVEDPITAGLNTFHLAYHGINDRELYAQIARVYMRVCPALTYVAPHCRAAADRSQPASGRKLRVGFVSKYFYNHSVSHHYGGIIHNLSHDRFHVALLRYPAPVDDTARGLMDAADDVVTLSHHLPTAQEQAARLELDVLVFTDVGMDPYTYFLAFARLAHVQCVTTGHPVTTGIPNMDYFLSWAPLEPADADEHYTERLVRMRNMTSYLSRLSPPASQATRGDYGLSDNQHIYLCAQNLCKIHPNFDAIIGNILRADPQGSLLLFHGAERHWTECLLARFRQTIPDVMPRIQFLPNQPFPSFLRLLQLCDVVLDTTEFCGGTTTSQILGLGVPLVTLPGNFMRSRGTFACYQQMGMLDCVAQTPEEYVRIAVRLGTDAEYRQTIRTQIASRNGPLYENTGYVRELEDFFVQARNREFTPEQYPNRGV